MKIENVLLSDYSFGIWPRINKSTIPQLIDQCNTLAIQQRLIGELLDDDYIAVAPPIHLQNCSHLITNVRNNETGIYGDVIILDTPCGKIIQALREDFFDKFKFKIRATYLCTDEQLLNIVVDNIITWDIIYKSNLF